MPDETDVKEQSQGVSRRGLFGAGGSLLFGAAAMGIPGTAEAAFSKEELVQAANRPVFDLEHMPADPESGPGGSVQMARQKQFPFMTGATIARLIMQPNCSRAPHWHMNSWEVQFCISGSCKLSTVDEHGNLFEDILKPGYAGFAPQAWLHTLQTIGDEPCLMYVCWADPNLQTAELPEAMALLPQVAVAGALDTTVQELNTMNKKRVLITKNAKP
jgi:oxalate decarboxylase/phosphoglucose isomerase-like protein (cupin superfamily)